MSSAFPVPQSRVENANGVSAIWHWAALICEHLVKYKTFSTSWCPRHGSLYPHTRTSLSENNSTITSGMRSQENNWMTFLSSWTSATNSISSFHEIISPHTHSHATQTHTSTLTQPQSVDDIHRNWAMLNTPITETICRFGDDSFPVTVLFLLVQFNSSFLSETRIASSLSFLLSPVSYETFRHKWHRFRVSWVKVSKTLSVSCLFVTHNVHCVPNMTLMYIFWWTSTDFDNFWPKCCCASKLSNSSLFSQLT